jgi:SAM-dependent methyltransferase
MLDFLRRQRPKPSADPGTPADGGQRSLVFPKFLKRLAGRERPSVLDLGRLSGGNIEIFARLGCRVQVEDMVTTAEEKPSARAAASPAGSAAAPEAGAAAPEPGVTGPLPSGTDDAMAAATGAPIVGSVGGGAPPNAATPAPTPAAPGTRRSRHIVLPPRTFARSASAIAGARPAAAPPPRTPLATRFAYPDATFDGIVAWDLFNFYDPESARAVAADVARVLKPGGLVFAYFHSRSTDGAAGPARYRIVDETRLEAEPFSGRPLARHLYQNRDIEKMFTGLRIAELCFLKSGVREMVLEKRTPASAPPPGTPVARPRSRFRID